MQKQRPRLVPTVPADSAGPTQSLGATCLEYPPVVLLKPKKL